MRNCDPASARGSAELDGRAAFYLVWLLRVKVEFTNITTRLVDLPSVPLALSLLESGKM